MENELDIPGKKAERIVNHYGDALSADSVGIAKPISSLKNTKEEIKTAIKTYIESLIKANKLNKENIKVLSYGYASIDLFIDDKDANLFNQIEKLKGNTELPEEIIITYNSFVQKATVAMKENVEEITEFIKMKVPMK